jgi:hypothetical protein
MRKALGPKPGHTIVGWIGEDKVMKKDVTSVLILGDI